MEEMKDDILERVLGQSDLGPANPPDVQNMPA